MSEENLVQLQNKGDLTDLKNGQPSNQSKMSKRVIETLQAHQS
jgi:hypothetical protein